MNEYLSTPSGIIIPPSALGWKFSRSSGPGGQGVNTTDSQVELTCFTNQLLGDDEVLERVRAKLGESVVITASVTRSQLSNRKDAISRLLDRLEAASAKPKTRKPTRVPKRSAEARLRAKRIQSERKASRQGRHEG